MFFSSFIVFPTPQNSPPGYEVRIMTTVIIRPNPTGSKVFPWEARARSQCYSNVFETKEGAKTAMESRFGSCKFIERKK